MQPRDDCRPWRRGNGKQPWSARQRIDQRRLAGVDLADHGNGETLLLHGIEGLDDQLGRFGVGLAHQLVAKLEQTILEALQPRADGNAAEPTRLTRLG